MFKRVPFIEQIEDSECGLACTAMLLGYYGHSITLHEIREQFGISKGGSSLAHLAQIGAHYCMKSKGLKTDFPGLASVPLPAIAQWDHHRIWKR
ncbi:cysteine peptidase family C39 domain-containing protein [Paenibacillus apiarius]|uniref:cysteine peptidase family C39 domain-containing protein n=1 Tax=Paenibacillus apiarius TaxID=46240 RepID=UPI001982464A|nr:cysteine peptidase family C39 domain-containing protein [Paenibacillus apiarius]MBN3524017.1 hypothetical protein [Paenibacillus apiarius]